MPLYEFECPDCGKREERQVAVEFRHDQDCACGGRLDKLMVGSTAVHDDTIIGGFWQEHFGPQPEYFDSRKKMAARATELNLKPYVRHRPDHQGTDKSKRTSRWI